MAKLPKVDGVNASLTIAAACFGGDQSVTFDDCDVLAHFGISDGASSNGSTAQWFSLTVDRSMYLASATYDAVGLVPVASNPVGSVHPANNAMKHGPPPPPPPTSSAAQRLKQNLASNSVGPPAPELRSNPVGAPRRKRSTNSGKNLRPIPTATPAPRLAPAVAVPNSPSDGGGVSWSKALEYVAKSLDHHAACVKNVGGASFGLGSVDAEQAPFATVLDSGDVLSELSEGVLSEETFSSEALSAEGISEEEECLISEPMPLPAQKGHGEKHLIVQYDLTVRSMLPQWYSLFITTITAFTLASNIQFSLSLAHFLEIFCIPLLSELCPLARVELGCRSVPRYGHQQGQSVQVH